LGEEEDEEAFHSRHFSRFEKVSLREKKAFTAGFRRCSFMFAVFGGQNILMAVEEKPSSNFEGV
jgi:hypothetical protein